ncbi:MAG: DUF262 domain-containing protein [Acidimicrobiales bacterium]
MTTSTLVRRPKSETFDIAELVSLALRGRLRVPRFQRSFVWTANDVRELFDSIWRGFPIGTLLLWKRPAEAGKVAFGPLEFDAPAAEDAYSVVDGQQRITTLVASLSFEGEDVDPRFDLCFDLRNARFVQAGRRPRPEWWLPLRVSLESRRLLNWLREHGDDLSQDELNLADEFGGALRDYRVPAYIVEHDDEELLREIFDRVNSAGQPISRAQIFHALWGGTAQTASAAAVVESLNHERFGQLDEQRVVQSLLALRGGDVQRDLHDEFAPNEDRQRWFDDTERALARAIGFLRLQGVPHQLLAPTTFPLPVLAAFFHLHPQPDPWNERLLARWLWRGWARGFGRAGQTPALRQAVRTVHPRKGAPEEAPSEYDAVRTLLESVPDEGPEDIYPSPFQTNAAAGRLGLLALASLEPRRLDAEPVDIVAELEQRGVDAVSELVTGHRSEFAARGFWPLDQPPPTGREGSDVLASHSIYAPAADALRRGDVASLLRHRAEQLRHLIRRFLAARLDTGATVRPPLADLYVPDEPLEAVG